MQNVVFIKKEFLDKKRMIDFQQVLNTNFAGNLGMEYVMSLGVFIGLLIILKIFKVYILAFLKKLAKRTKSDTDNIIIQFIDKIHWPFFVFVSYYVAVQTLKIPEVLKKINKYIFLILVVFYVVRGINGIVDYIIRKQINKRHKADKKESTSFILLLGKFTKAVFWFIALLLVLSNLGIDITSLVAGLGVGGIAIAFALKSILEDLFSAFTIYFDKPFQEGDFIVIGEDSGTVQHIGLKSTRVKTLKGEELIVSNTELTSTRVHNYKKMEKRRIVFGFGIEYSTSTVKLKKINKIIEDIFKKVKDADLSRVHFKEFADFSLNYEIVYQMKTKDYEKYMDTQEEINLKIKEQFEKAKISMAFPTQTIHLRKK